LVLETVSEDGPLKKLPAAEGVADDDAVRPPLLDAALTTDEAALDEELALEAGAA